MKTGIVIKSTGSWYLVKNGENDIYKCNIKGIFRIKGLKTTNPITVGDNVKFNVIEEKKTGVITEIFDRKNYIIRRSSNLSKLYQILIRHSLL